MEEKQLAEIVQSIKEIVQAAFYDDKNLWTPDRCANYLGYSKNHFVSRIAIRSDFPAPIALPTGSGKNQTSRWQSDEVKAWANKFKTKRTAA